MYHVQLNHHSAIPPPKVIIKTVDLVVTTGFTLSLEEVMKWQAIV